MTCLATFWRTAAAALWLMVAGAGCASTPPSTQVAPASARVTFVNTTDTCSAGVLLEVTAGGQAHRVAPGATVAFALTEGTHSATVMPVGGVAMIRRWTVPPGDSQQYVGCAAPEFLSPGPGRVAVSIIHLPHSCAPGRRAQVSVGFEGRPVAAIPVGASVTRWLPAGALVVSLDGRFFPSELAAVEVVEGGAPITVGCDFSTNAPHRPQPLTLLGPSLACPAGTESWFAAAGVQETLARGEAWTVFAPAGTHEVRVSAPADSVATLALVTLDGAGRLVETMQCAP